MRSIRAADRLFGGGISMSSLYRRFVVAFPGPLLVDISTILELNKRNNFISAMVPVPAGAHAQGASAQEA